MNKMLLMCLIILFSASCKKTDDGQDPRNCIDLRCLIDQQYMANAAKVTITNGVWGTVASTEGNCMPTVGGTNTCTTCAVKKTVQIYAYTTLTNAVIASPSGFYNSFSTQLVKQVVTDDEGFFQTDLPSGNYTIVVLENGKIYASGLDGTGGISPFSFTTGLKNINFTLTYKAVF